MYWIILYFFLLFASPAQAATTQFFAGSDVATNDTPVKTSVFTGGVGGTAPRYRSNSVAISASTNPYWPSLNTTLFTSAVNNRMLIDFDSSSADGVNSNGTVLLGSTYTQLLAGMYTLPMLGAMPICVGPTRNGSPCNSAANCGSGYCKPQRRPLISLATSTEKGCSLYHWQTCTDQGLNTISGACSQPLEHFAVLYGNAQEVVGRCQQSVEMVDTVCGQSCTTVADCLPGRPDYLSMGSNPTACVRDENETLSCDGSDCHCINECDELRPNEAKCSPSYFGLISRAQNSQNVMAVEQVNGTGEVTCKFYSGEFGKLCTAGTAPSGSVCNVNADCGTGGVCTSNLPVVYQRGLGTQRVGKCTGGDSIRSRLANGGTLNLACATNTDCECNTTWPTYNLMKACVGGTNAGATCTVNGDCNSNNCSLAGSCVNASCTTTGLTSPYTSLVSPDRVLFGPDDSGERSRVFGDNLIVQTGSSPSTNWVSESLWVDANGADLGWVGTGCSGAGNEYKCLTGNGTVANEPDGNTTRISENTSVDDADWLREVEFQEPTSRSFTPLAAVFNVAAQDTEGSDTLGAGVQLSLRDIAGTPNVKTGTSFDLNNFVPDDGTGDTLYFPVPFLINTNPDNSTISYAGIDDYIGEVHKTVFHKNGDQARITFADLEVVSQSPTPIPSDVLPGDKRVGLMGDSRTDQSTVKVACAASMIEASAIYDQARGGASMGDIDRDFYTLAAGQSGTGNKITTIPITGTGGLAIDVAFIQIANNTVHPVATAAPYNNSSYGGILKNGFCESWTAAGGYGTDQGKECSCPETSNWDSEDYPFVAFCAMAKNSTSFGLANISGPCSCSSSSECHLGGAGPFPSTCSGGANNGLSCTKPADCPSGTCGTITTTTCSSNVCVTARSSVVATASAATHADSYSGCTPATGAVGCSGICATSNTLARMIRGKRSIDDKATMRCRGGTQNGQTCSSGGQCDSGVCKVVENVWVTSAPTNSGVENGKQTGWFEGTQDVISWRSWLVAEQIATGGNFVDSFQYFIDKGGASILTKDASHPYLADKVHYTQEGSSAYCDLLSACAANVDFAGNLGKKTDGVCNTAPTCSTTCQSGFLKGRACSTAADCYACSAGADSKIGLPCSQDKQCGYYFCDFD